MAATNGSTASFWMLLRFDPFVQPGPTVIGRANDAGGTRSGSEDTL